MAFSLVHVLVFLIAIINSQLADAGGRAEIVHQCSYPVWCAVVKGFKPDDPTPQDQRPPVQWIPQPAGQVIIDYFTAHPIDTGMALMCTRDPAATKPAVTQLEYTWRPDLDMTFFDASNVEGTPFLNEGFRMDVHEPLQPQGPACYPAHCAPGDKICGEIYNKWNDDFQGMRSCSPEMVMRMNLCSAKSSD
ncbi:hypothetical protein LTR84_002596 [Exophiala bonariae]|uniref:Ig-like domain-containing protein n=1 Tax=Exophiala bonariae TaxID=1690606 RepID=A0AAV9N9T0_9EURO|nr:hypothetical protein LTR84_002596 [Exophiala bonariae]